MFRAWAGLMGKKPEPMPLFPVPGPADVEHDLMGRIDPKGGPSYVVAENHVLGTPIDPATLKGYVSRFCQGCRKDNLMLVVKKTRRMCQTLGVPGRNDDVLLRCEGCGHEVTEIWPGNPSS